MNSSKHYKMQANVKVKWVPLQQRAQKARNLRESLKKEVKRAVNAAEHADADVKLNNNKMMVNVIILLFIILLLFLKDDK